jgi:hypothetical protein
MKLLNFNKVLCLSPHPDDVELGMMGTILKHSDTHFDILCMTKGGAKGFDLTNNLNRLDEVIQFWKVANCKNANIIFSDCEYFEDKNSTPGWVNWIENNLIFSGKYDCIFLPTIEDSMYEHKFVQSLGFALTRTIPISLIEYKTVSTLNTWQANMFIDIEKEFKIKIKCLKEFVSQQNKLYFQKEVLKTFHLNFQCKKKGINLIESFKIIDLIQ